MKVDVSSSKLKVYNIEKFDVVVGDTFSLLTDLPDTSKTHWFSDGDPVLSMDVQGNNANVEATTGGNSLIQIQDENYALIKVINITVVDAITDPAKILGLKATSKQPKD